MNLSETCGLVYMDVFTLILLTQQSLLGLQLSKHPPSVDPCTTHTVAIPSISLNLGLWRMALFIIFMCLCPSFYSRFTMCICNYVNYVSTGEVVRSPVIGVTLWQAAWCEYWEPNQTNSSMVPLPHSHFSSPFLFSLGCLELSMWWRTSWAWTCRDPPAFASQVLELKAYTTIPGPVFF